MTNRHTPNPFTRTEPLVLGRMRVHGHIVAVVEDIGDPTYGRVMPLEYIGTDRVVSLEEWITVPDYAEAILRERVPAGLSEDATVARAADVLRDLAVDGEGVYFPGEEPYQRWPDGWPVVHTGGGCRHAQVAIPGGGEVLACDGEGVAPRVGEPWVLGVYDADGSPVVSRTVKRPPTPAEVRAWGAAALRRSR